MFVELTPEQKEARQRFRGFVAEHVAPHAAAWDRDGAVPMGVIDRLRDEGLLGTSLDTEHGGSPLAAIPYGLLTEEIGRGCSSLRSLLTVHDMVSLALQRWGKPAVKEAWLPRLARAEKLAALALSEPGIGSDAAGVETTARQQGDEWVLDGCKTWITFGEIADAFLVFAQVVAEDGSRRPAGFWVPAETPGLERSLIGHVVGTRASRLATLVLDGCRVGADHLLGRPGFGISHVATTALDLGRYSVAWGAVGIAQACLDACLGHTTERRQFDVPLREHQLVARHLTDMIVAVRAARLLCYRAGHLRQERDPGAMPETMIAKYHASRTAVDVANRAVHLHGARGLSTELPLERLLRDAKVTEIIEGSSEIQQISIPRFPLTEL